MEQLPVHPNAHITELFISNEKPMPQYVVSDGVSLKRITECSKTEIYELFSSAKNESFEYCGWENTETLQDAEEYLSKRNEGWEKEEKFSYGILLKGKLVGVTYAKRDPSSKQTVSFGLWLHNDYWGQGISGLRADVLIPLSFLCLGVEKIWVGCLEMNNQSRRAIEKYIRRYNGLFYGAPLVKSSSYSDFERPFIPHYEYAITLSQFCSCETGISTSLPQTEYSDLF